MTSYALCFVGTFLACLENVLKKIFIFGILERRIIYNYTEYGDTPACIGEKLDLDSQPGILQGSVMRVGSDTFGDPIFQNSLQN